MNHEFYDVHDVNVAIANKLIHSFAEIPSHLQSDEVADEWFFSMATVRKKPLETCLNEVPTELWTEKFLTTVVRSGCNILRFIDPGKDALSKSLCFTCVRVNYKALVALDPKYREEFTEHLVWNNLRELHLIARDFPWVREHIQENAVSRCCLNMDFTMGYDVLPDGVGRRIITNGEGFEKIRAHGRLDVLAEQIAQGEWPKQLSAFGYPGERPKSLDDGIYCASETSANNDRQALYMAYVMTHPMDQVVPLMCERRLHKLVLEMYSKEALTPYMRKYRDLRGVVLEEALGL